MKIYIVRHGETDGNKNRIAQGQLDGKLTEQGKKQAIELGISIKDKIFDIVYSSDLGRARKTTELVTKQLKKLPKTEFTDLLRERYFGSIQGKSLKEIGIEDEKGDYLYEVDQEGIFSDAEPIEAIRKRLQKFLREKVYNSNAESILVIGHDWSNSYLMNLLLDEEIENKNFHSSKHCTLNYFRLDHDGKVVEKRYNFM